MRLSVLLLVLLLLNAPAWAQSAPPIEGEQPYYVALAFHDVVDRREDLTFDAVTTSELIRFFDWLRGDGWTVISIDDIDRAQAGIAPLPQKAVLLTFDDGYASVYSRVYPLLLAYRYPAVVALTGAWMAGATDGTVDYGDRDVPRTDFLSWDQVREMAASGLVEIASHSYNLHIGVLANPQGNRIPAAATWIYDPASGQYENDAAYRARIRQDLTTARDQIAAELGVPPRILVWPFGRRTGLASEIAREAGFSHEFSLLQARNFIARIPETNRVYPTARPALADLARNIHLDEPIADTNRIACFSLAGLAGAPSLDVAEQGLGRIVDVAYGLGANIVVLDITGAPPLDPTGVDILSHAVWQLRTRANAEVYLHIPGTPDPRLYADLLRRAKADGLVLPASPDLMAAGADVPSPPAASQKAVMRRRDAMDPSSLEAGSRAAFDAFRAAAAIEPEIGLMLLAQDGTAATRWPAPIADLLLLPAPSSTAEEARALHRKGWLDPSQSGRVAFTLPAGTPAALSAATRALQAEGATALALCPGTDLSSLSASDVSVLAPAFSSVHLPRVP